MGKHPAKWIKNWLFGKKSTGSHSNKRDGNDKGYVRRSGTSLFKNSLEISEPVLVSPHGTAPTTGSGTLPSLQGEGAVAPNISHGAYKQEIVVSDVEKLREHEAATKAQAVVRGYLARRAFRALKGIIRLQALIRGHLVRRQAVATLRAMQAIIKLQALVRGRSVRSSTIACNVGTKNWKQSTVESKSLDTWKEKLSKTAFVSKLLSSPTLTSALHFEYHLDNPNSVFSWLERWTKAQVWVRTPQFKRAVDSKPQARRANNATESKAGKLKRNHRRNPAVRVDPGQTTIDSESDKRRFNLRKLASSPTDIVKDDPQHEIKVKRNLRKASNTKSEVPDCPEQSNDNLLKVKKKSAVTPENKPEIVTSIISETGKGQIDSSTNVEPKVESQPLQSIENEDNALVMNGALSSKEEQPSSESQRTRGRSSNLAKSDCSENGLQTVPVLPSYMATTESAKAKSRGQISPQFGSDSADINGIIMLRHSLPSSVNGNLYSNSPRTQRPAQASGTGGFKSDRSLSLSKDGTVRTAQVEWRR